jgi:hypothetical protein
MLAQILALFAAAAAQAAPADAPAAKPPTAANTLSPLTVLSRPKTQTPVDVTIEVAADDTASGEYVSIWPRGAYRDGADGYVVLRCRVNVHGLAELCGVKSEDPVGKGFGAAALQLRPTFKLTPAKGADGPIESQMDIAVKFRAPRRDLDVENLHKATDLFAKGDPYNNVRVDDRIFQGNPMASQAVTMLSHPVWAAAPGFDDVAQAYPATAGGAEGYVVAHCQVAPTGDLKNCISVKETPAALGFAKAALTLTPKFKVAPDLAVAPDRKPLWVDIPIRLPPPDAQKDRAITTPQWLTSLDAAPNPFPALAAARGVTSGVGVADCVVGPAGALVGCTPLAAEPDGLGFSEAVAQLASIQKVAIWSDDAGPVLGGRIRLELRLEKDSDK